ncbi:restriction endonuclease subunit S [Vibrio cyclitrophicus]
MVSTQQYKIVKLSEIADFKTGRLNANAAVEGGEYPFFTCSRDSFRTNTWSFDCECVLLAGNNANAEYPVKYFEGKFDAYQRTYVITAKDSRSLNIRYLYYCIELKLNVLKSLSTGSATRFLTKTILDHLEFHLPEKRIQDKIVDNLSRYDNLVENNNRRIAILEEMAQSLYSEWFVNFRYPGNDKNNNKLTLIDSPLGTIPEGWEIKRLDDFLILQRGFDLPKKKRNESGGIPIYAASGINGYHDQVKAKGPGVVTGRSGTLGIVNLVLEDHWPLNTSLWVKEFKGCTAFYAYYLLDSIGLERFNSGASVPTLNRNDVHGNPVIAPPKELIEKFEDTVCVNHKQINVLKRKNENLKKQRAMLLPRLISGDIEL